MAIWDMTRRRMTAVLATATAGVAAGYGLLRMHKGKRHMGYSPTDATAITGQFPIDFQWPTADPFLFCAYHRDEYPAGDDEMAPQADLSGRRLGSDFQMRDGFRMYHGEKVPGFPGHPHRGFETITIVREGLVDHADSLGAAGRYGAGDVQWMTAGAGIQHSEMFPLVAPDRANPLELFQVWLNLPAKSKFADPHFKMLWREQVPELQADNAKVDLIAGGWEDQQALPPPPASWAANPQSDVMIMVIELDRAGRLTLPAGPSGVNRRLYLHRGDKVELGGQVHGAGTGFELDPSKSLSLLNQGDPAALLLLQGRPIGEPVVQHGPFVMNSKAEIIQTVQDYQRTRFGGWPWTRQDMVHDRSRGRFARHADGNEEIPS